MANSDTRSDTGQPGNTSSSGMGTVRALSEATLGSLAPGIERPTYDRRALVPSVVHLGVGGFHRAHQAVYLDDLAQRGISTDWGIHGVGLRPDDHLMHEALVPQDFLYTVVVRSAEQDTARVIGSLTDHLYAPGDPARVLASMADPRTRIVSLTITEGGYNLNQVTGEFEAGDPAVQHDLRTPATPSSVFGYVCEALDRRRLAGHAPFTLLSCDNVQGNGSVAKRMFLAFATLRDPALAAWIEANVAFPNCMVDRITPRTTDADRALVARSFGIADAWPVVTEPFIQWVVEDTFCNGRPPLEEVGVQMVADVHPYEMMKIRLLNASHSAMSFLGYVAGFRYIDDLMANPEFKLFITRLMDEEVTPLLPPVPGIDLTTYKRTLLERFGNPKVRDQVARVCQDGSNRVPKFVVPSLREALAAGRPHRLLTLAVAGWLRYLGGTDDEGQPIEIDDPRVNDLRALAVRGKDDPRPLLGVHALFGDLDADAAFVSELQEVLHDLYTLGASATLRRYLAA